MLHEYRTQSDVDEQMDKAMDERLEDSAIAEAHIDDAHESDSKRSASAKQAKTTENNRFVVRLPADLHQQIKMISKRNNRSMNAEIVLLLQNYLFEQRLSDDSLEASLKRELSVLDDAKRQALLALLG